MTTKKSSKSSPIVKSSSPLALTQYQAFKVERVARGQITGVKWNPRKISPTAKKKLQRVLKTFGLLEPVVVNRNTMELVGGHQRLACIDALEGHEDYSLDVSMVELTDKQEREANLMLNNLELQGEWDLPLLAAVIPEISIESAGFEPTTLDVIFDGTDYAPLFSVEAQAPQAQDALKEMAEMSELDDEEKPADAPPNDQDVTRKASAEAVAEMRKSSKGMAAHEDTERYRVIIFNSRKEAEDFNESIGADRTLRNILASYLAQFMK